MFGLCQNLFLGTLPETQGAVHSYTQIIMYNVLFSYMLIKMCDVIYFCLKRGGEMLPQILRKLQDIKLIV